MTITESERIVLAVPEITITDSQASSDAAGPVHIPGTCACWSDRSRYKAKHLLLANKVILCMDCTAWAAVTALALELMMAGNEIKPDIRKGYAASKEGIQ